MRLYPTCDISDSGETETCKQITGNTLLQGVIEGEGVAQSWVFPRRTRVM